MFDKGQGPGSDKIAKGELQLHEFDFSGTTDWQERTVPLNAADARVKSSDPPSLLVRVKIACNNAGGVTLAKGLLAAPPEPSEPPATAPLVVKERSVAMIVGECDFSWGSFSSSYSTSISGYTNYANGTISDIHSGEEGLHYHYGMGPKAEKKRKAPEARCIGPLVLSGTVLGARGLPKADSDGTDSYVVVNLENKGGKEKKKVQSVIVHDTSDLDWNFNFDLGQVRKGQVVEFPVFQHHRIFAEQPLGYGKIEIKNIELDSAEPIEITLEKPKKFKKPKWKFDGYGKLRVRFHLAVQLA
jgi:hypothetical protein